MKWSLLSTCQSSLPCRKGTEDSNDFQAPTYMVGREEVGKFNFSQTNLWVMHLSFVWAHMRPPSLHPVMSYSLSSLFDPHYTSHIICFKDSLSFSLIVYWNSILKNSNSRRFSSFFWRKKNFERKYDMLEGLATISFGFNIPFLKILWYYEADLTYFILSPSLW